MSLSSKKKKIKNFPLYLQILLGMVVGVIVGFIALSFESIEFVNQWIKPWGRLFMRLLQLIAVPLVFVSIVKGIMDVMDVGRFAKIGIRTIIIYICTTVIAVLFGLSLALLVKPGNFVNKDISDQKDKYSMVIERVSQQKNIDNSPLDFLDQIVPSNFIASASDNSKILQIIFFAVLFGIAVLLVPNENVDRKSVV